MSKTEPNKTSVVVSPTAFASMILHAARHNTQAVHGILLGSKKGDVVTVQDAVPVCHEPPTLPLVDAALGLVQQTTDQSVVGWFTSPQLLEDDRPGPVSLRMAANLAKPELEPVLLMLCNVPLGKILKNEESTENVIKAFGKDFGGQWLQDLSIRIENEAKAAAAVRKARQDGVLLNDLVDHWEDSSSSEWYPNAALRKCVENMC